MFPHLIPPDKKDTIDDVIKELDKPHLESRKHDHYRNLFCIAASQTVNLDADNRIRANELINNYKDAANYAINNYNGNTTNLIIDLQEIAGRVEPRQSQPNETYADFRDEQVRLYGMNYFPPPNKQSIHNSLESLIRFSQTHDLHPVEQAVFFNFNLIRIHPLKAGNKRSASVYMNAILNHNGYPAVAVNQRERTEFLDMFEDSIHEFKQNMHDTNEITYDTFGPAQRQYFDFYAEKVLQNAQDTTLHREALPTFHLTLADIDEPSTLYGVEQHLYQPLQHQSSKPPRIKVNPDTSSLKITADINEEQLHAQLNPLNIQYKISYQNK